jgi:tripartite-type tricarboxylate transporter receptor subunit TctC
MKTATRVVLKQSMKKTIAGIALALSGALGLGMVGSAHAQDKQALKILVGYPPGGSVDVLARLLADSLRDDFASIVVDNKPGAGGRIALGMAKAAKPDGQTLIVAPSGPMVVFPHVYKKLDYDPVKDFTPISLLGVFQLGVTAGPNTNVKTVAELLAKAKTDPKSATYASSGLGTLPHFLGVMLEQNAGTSLIHVPFQGGAPANVALLGGHVSYKIDVVSESVELHRAGKARLIAVTGTTRDAQVPEVPTLRESGINMDATGWFAVYGPAGMGADQVQRFNQLIVAAIKRPANMEKMKSLGVEVIGSSAAGLAEAQRNDLQRWEKPIKATGISLD